MHGGAVTHLIPSTTFLPFVASAFEEAAPSENLFLVYGSGDLPNLPEGVRAEAIGMGAPDLVRVAQAIGESRVAIVHSMSTFSAQALAVAPASVLRVWSGWGGEYYGSRFDPLAGLLGPATARLMRRRHSLRERAAHAYNARYLDSLLRAAAIAADVFSAPVPADFAVFRRRFRGFQGRYHQLNYSSVEATYAIPPDHTTGRDVLLGNSATPENNHLETLAMLARLDLGGRRVIAPLSYGDPLYAKDVAQAGSDLLGDSFVAVREYLPLAEYSALVAACDVVVMGHRRQQALGNLARAAWQGARIYLDRRSPLLSYFRSVGLDVQSHDDLLAHGFPPEAKAVGMVEADRRIELQLWGHDVVIRNIRSLLSEA